MTKRSTIIALIIAAILSLFLAIITPNFNGFWMILPIFTYFFNIVFIEADAYYKFIKKTKDDYHFYSMALCRDILLIQMIMYHIIGIQGKFDNVEDLCVHLAMLTICVLDAIVSTILKNRALKDIVPDDWD